MLQHVLALLVGITVLVFPVRLHKPAGGMPFDLKPSATVLFGGDMMFDRTVRNTTVRLGGDYIFSCIDDTLAAADLVVANLEGPITEHASVSEGSVVGSPKNYVFTFPPATAALLLRHHVGLVNLGNNHVYNFGTAGVRTTREYLDAAGVGNFGISADDVAYRVINGIQFAFINYNEFVYLERGRVGGDATTTVARIASARAFGYRPIVFAHWGVEYATTSSEQVRALAHQFVDAGAALVVGSHPHVVQEHEVYHGVPLYYSLGNFIFDQYWDDTVDHGLLLSATFTPAGITTLKEIPIVIDRDGQPCLGD